MNNLQQHFCSYEISKELKELGWDEYNFGVYLNKGQLFRQVMGLKNYPPEIYPDVVNAILWQQSLEFLREKYGIHLDIDFGYKGWGYGFIPVGCQIKLPTTFEDGHDWAFEQAQTAGIEKAIELIKTNKV